MTVVRAEKLLRSPPKTVFDFVAAHHFENHPRWDPDVLEMHQTSPGTVGVGTKAHIVRRQGNRRSFTGDRTLPDPDSLGQDSLAVDGLTFAPAWTTNPWSDQRFLQGMPAVAFVQASGARIRR